MAVGGWCRLSWFLTCPFSLLGQLLPVLIVTSWGPRQKGSWELDYQSNTVTTTKNCSWREPSPRSVALPRLLLFSSELVGSGEHQRLLGSRGRAPVLKVWTGKDQKSWRGTEPRVTNPGAAVTLATESASAGRSWPREDGPCQTVSSSLMSQICVEMGETFSSGQWPSEAH